MNDYLCTMKKYSNGLALVDRPVLAQDLISQVLSRLDEEYNPVAVLIQSRPGVSCGEMQAKLISYEKRLKYQLSLKSGFLMAVSDSPSINMAQSKPITEQRNQRSSSEGQRGSQNRGTGRWTYNSTSRPICQVCGKLGHTTTICYFQCFNKEVKFRSISSKFICKLYDPPFYQPTRYGCP